MSLIGISKATVELDLGKVHKDAFTANKILLYIPVTQNGEVVTVEKAARLECWKSTSLAKEEIPYSLQKDALTLCNLLIKNPEDHTFANLSRSVAFGSLSAMDRWLKTLLRHPDGDLLDFVLYNAEQ